jgi:peroxiredoxin
LAFKFNGALANPVKAQLTLDRHAITDKANPYRIQDFATIYLEGSAIKVNSGDSIKNATISGSDIQDESNRFKQIIATQEHAIADLRVKLSVANSEKQKDTAYIAGLNRKQLTEVKTETAAEYAYIAANPDHFFSLLLLIDVSGYRIDAGIAGPAYQKLSAEVRNSPTGLEFSQKINTAYAVSVGSTAPDFTQNDVNGKPVNLSDFRGKYVLLDFWASWCVPCRAENPNVVRIYNKFKDKNFTVLGVSLDLPGKREAWLAAIKADHLEWTEVADLKFWDNIVAKKYGIRSIPQNFLIDPSGKIIAVNLRGKALEDALREYIK